MKTRLYSYQYYDLLVAYFVAFLLISNIAATKLIALGPFIADGGALLFPFTYIIGDVLAEVYGLKKTRRAVIIAFVASALAAIVFLAVQYLPGAPEYANQAAFEAVLGFVPNIVIASLAAFFAGQLVNAYVLVKIKEKWGEKNLWVRLIGSTIAGQFVDTIVFCTVAFYGILEGWSFVNYVLVGIAYKVSIEIILLPVTYRVIAFVRRKEKVLTEE